MGDAQNHHHQQQPSRLGLRSEIVEVEGGHIVRSTGRKDRHSKVCTSKGPRDRRVRLSAYTAIQFYDVQDRLGYDRPSKAVDWLIKKAKSAIDELDELPAWKPSTGSTANNNFEHEQVDNVQSRPSINSQREQNSSFLPSSMDTDSNSSAMQFQSLTTPELLSRASSHSQDLRLSLQSFQDPMLLYHRHNQQAQNHQNENTLFPGLGFDGSGWSIGGETTVGGGGGAFVFNAPPLYGQSQYFSQRGTLQSSNTPSVRAWIDQPFAISTSHQNLPFHHQASISGTGIHEFAGFRIPARIQGEDEEHDGISDKPSSASSDSRH